MFFRGVSSPFSGVHYCGGKEGWVVAVSGGRDVSVRRCVVTSEKTHILNVRCGRMVGQLRELVRFLFGNGMLLFNCPAGIQRTRGEDFASC